MLRHCVVLCSNWWIRTALRYPRICVRAVRRESCSNGESNQWYVQMWILACLLCNRAGWLLRKSVFNDMVVCGVELNLTYRVVNILPQEVYSRLILWVEYKEDIRFPQGIQRWWEAQKDSILWICITSKYTFLKIPMIFTCVTKII